MEFDLKQLGLGQRIAAAGAVLLFIFFFFFHWYGISVGNLSAGINGWHAHTILRWLVLLTIILAIGDAVRRATSRDVTMPVSPSVVVFGVSALTTLCIAWRVIVDHPGPSNGGIGVEFGAIMGLLSLIAVAVGEFLAMQEEGISLSGAGGQVRGAFSGGSKPADTMTPAASAPAAPAPS